MKVWGWIVLGLLLWTWVGFELALALGPALKRARLEQTRPVDDEDED